MRITIETISIKFSWYYNLAFEVSFFLEVPFFFFSFFDCISERTEGLFERSGFFFKFPLMCFLSNLEHLASEIEFSDLIFSGVINDPFNMFSFCCAWECFFFFFFLVDDSTIALSNKMLLTDCRVCSFFSEIELSILDFDVVSNDLVNELSF